MKAIYKYLTDSDDWSPVFWLSYLPDWFSPYLFYLIVWYFILFSFIDLHNFSWKGFTNLKFRTVAGKLTGDERIVLIMFIFYIFLILVYFNFFEYFLIFLEYGLKIWLNFLIWFNDHLFSSIFKFEEYWNIFKWKVWYFIWNEYLIWFWNKLNAFINYFIKIKK